MNRLNYALVLGLLASVLGISLFLSPYGQKIEEDLGLALLFKIRGPRNPPDDVVIVNLDPASSSILGLPENFGNWPRTVHARMIDTLNKQGAAFIVFDVHFVEARDEEQDLAFAAAVQQAGNVILFEELKRQSLNTEQKGQATGIVEMDTLVPPFTPLAEYALALAPYPLPKLPVRVNQSWIFKTSAGDKPTLPAVALQAVGLKSYERLHALLSAIDPDITSSLPPTSREALSQIRLEGIILNLRGAFQKKPLLARQLLAELDTMSAQELSSEDRRLILALIMMYAGENSIHLNLYGPPATLPTFSYHELLAPVENGLKPIEVNFKDKVIFVGAARKTWSGQNDGFYTVFSQPNGLDLSGVEIAATTFANLLENMPVRPLAHWQNILILLICGLGAGLVCFLFSPLIAVGTLIVFSAAYLVASNYYFTLNGTWPTIVTSLAVQPSFAFLSAVLLKYFKAEREKENISKALGYYLPDKVVNELSRDLSFITTGDQMVYSACLMTDAQHYTTLSEEMDPRELSGLIKEYYSYLFEPVRDNKGLVCDVVGDSMLALWPSAKPHSQLRKNACHASLQVLAAVERFNREHPDTTLPTRIGLHYGYILMGNIGAESHFEYAPVGDIINTVSRIEELNKHLGTRILASEETVRDVPGILTRKLGEFLLAGKTKPVRIYELLSEDDGINPENEALRRLFSEALGLFQEKRWSQAIKAFDQCIALQGADGPSSFYLQFCRTYQQEPPPTDWRGVIQIGKK